MLRLSEDECCALLEVLWGNSITGLALVSEDGTFRRANASFCRLLEYSEAELKRLRFQDVTDPVDVKADEEMAALVALGEYESYDYTKNYVCKTKRLQPVLLRVSGIRLNNKFMYFCAEVAPLDSPPAERAIDSDIHARASRHVFWRGVKDHWQMIVAALGGAGIVAGQIIQTLRK